MIDQARTESTDWVALVALCLLLAAAVTMRLPASQGGTPGAGSANGVEAIDLGDGVSLALGAASGWKVLLGTCSSPVMIDVVEPSPHGRDASLTAPPDPGDRVFYAYRGWTLGGRLAAAELSVLHVAWRAKAIMLHMDGTNERGALAVKINVPAGCSTGPEEVLAVLRRDVLDRR